MKLGDLMTSINKLYESYGFSFEGSDGGFIQRYIKFLNQSGTSYYAISTMTNFGEIEKIVVWYYSNNKRKEAMILFSKSSNHPFPDLFKIEKHLRQFLHLDATPFEEFYDLQE